MKERERQARTLLRLYIRRAFSYFNCFIACAELIKILELYVGEGWTIRTRREAEVLAIKRKRGRINIYLDFANVEKYNKMN